MHPDTGCTRIQRTESRGVDAGRKRRSIDLRDSDRGVTSFVVCGDGAEYRLAIGKALPHGSTAGVPWLVGKYDKGTVGQNGEQEIQMVGWSVVGV